MGWFWADSAPRATISVQTTPPRPAANTRAERPPSACPVRQVDNATIPFPPRADPASNKPTSCPMKSPNHPLRHSTSPDASQSDTQQPPSQSSTISKLNPLNYIPSGLSNSRSDDSPQTVQLPLERETSSIPRGDASTNWEYPSPQQMYNAMLRKGYTETPTDAVESMVAVHNFLNEGAWSEIVEWERIFNKGLAHGWEMCSKGEQGMALERAKEEFFKAQNQARGISVPAESVPKLLRFQGRPNEPTPKARLLQTLGSMFPEKFGSEPPFDRHDWYVQRHLPDGTTREVRYVIDYYAGGIQATGEPVFYLDIRPALDSPTAAVERAMRWGGDIWHRASGASVRKQTKTNS